MAPLYFFLSLIIHGVGTYCTMCWYGMYLMLVSSVPGVGTTSTKRWYQLGSGCSLFPEFTILSKRSLTLTIQSGSFFIT